MASTLIPSKKRSHADNETVDVEEDVLTSPVAKKSKLSKLTKKVEKYEKKVALVKHELEVAVLQRLLQDSQHRVEDLEVQKQEALGVAMSYGNTYGSHHKMWVIDQMVRKLCGDDETYKVWIMTHNDGEDGPDTHEWGTCGIVPP